jgi:hypothetical protein
MVEENALAYLLELEGFAGHQIVEGTYRYTELIRGVFAWIK